MLNFFGQLFGTGFMPHQTPLGDPGVVVLHVASDSLIALSCFAIPAALLFVVRRRRPLTYPWIALLFAIFTFGLGASHLLAALSVLLPLYGFSEAAKAFTAIAAMAATVCFYRALPSLIQMPSPVALREEIIERERVEREIRDMNRYLELRVVERTNELERTNVRLVESELRMRNILDGAKSLVYVKDLQGRYTFVNEAFCRTSGRRREDILGSTDFDLFGAEFARIYRENDRRALDSGAIECEETGEAGGGTVYLSSKFALKDFEGRPYAICGMSNDVTERREAEKLLIRAHEDMRNSEERLRQIMDLVPDMLWSANVDTTVRFISQRYLKYAGYSPQDFENYGFLSLFHPEDLHKITSTYRDAIETGDPAEVEVRIRRHDGVYRWFLSRTVPVWNENFQVEYLIGAVTDIDELKRTEQALRRSNEELEQFAYAAAHDLQEPLRNVSTSLGMLERLVADRITPEEGEWIQKSIQNAVRMQAMVKDLLQYSRAVSDAEAPVSPANPETAIQAALSNLDRAIKESEAKIAVSPLPRVPVFEQHLVLLFQNLVSNSLKYRSGDRAPEISITAAPNGSECEFSVTDNGIGFDPVYAERIFKVFKRLHNRDEYAGNGIGLAICARIVTHYGGRIWAEASPGQGATFRFTLPTLRK